MFRRPSRLCFSEQDLQLIAVAKQQRLLCQAAWHAPTVHYWVDAIADGSRITVRLFYACIVGQTCRVCYNQSDYDGSLSGLSGATAAVNRSKNADFAGVSEAFWPIVTF